MNDLLSAAADLQTFCDGRGWRSCFIGGLAVQRWGEPRVTRDADLSLSTGFGNETAYVDELLGAYSPRLGDARDFALRSRVLLLRTSSGVGIDISLAALPFEELVIGRATPFRPAPGIAFRTCSAEDLILLKLFAARPVDLADAESVAVRQAGRLDWDYMQTELHPLADARQDAGMLANFARLRALPA